jgi:hypothetical protein
MTLLGTEPRLPIFQPVSSWLPNNNAYWKIWFGNFSIYGPQTFINMDNGTLFLCCWILSSPSRRVTLTKSVLVFSYRLRPVLCEQFRQRTVLAAVLRKLAVSCVLHIPPNSTPWRNHPNVNWCEVEDLKFMSVSFFILSCYILCRSEKLFFSIFSSQTHCR